MLANVQRGDWSRVLATPSGDTTYAVPGKPVRLYADSPKDEAGFVAWAPEGQLESRPFIQLQPFAQATPGTVFLMRVTTFRRLGNSNAVQRVWCQSAGWEFACTVGDIPGVATGGGGRVEFNGDERFCSGLSLIDGWLGAGTDAGWVGMLAAASKCPAWAKVPVLGAWFVKVEFASGDPSGAVGMNALWTQG